MFSTLGLLNKFSQLPLLAGALLLMTTKVYSQDLPVVTGASYDGQEVSWNPVESAVGYDIYLGASYVDTVVGTTRYRPEQLGTHVVAAFDGNGNYSPTVPADRTSLSNFVAVNELAPGVDQPENVTGIVYSTSAGEIFWDRAVFRTLEYDVFLDGAPIGTTTGGSMFINTLSANTTNLVSVVARAGTGETSEQVILEFNTQSGPFPAEANVSDADAPAIRPVSPQNIIVAVYGPNTLELFWDREPTPANIVSTDVFRDGEFIGSAVGNSFFDGNGSFSIGSISAVPHTYELIAIDGDGNRSLPAIFNPGAFDPGAFDDSTEAVVLRLLTGITEVTTNNPHVQFFPALRDLAIGGGLEALEEISTDLTFDGDNLLFSTTQFNCDSGTLTVEANTAAISSVLMRFELCNLSGIGNLDGVFTIVGSDAGGYTATYENLFIDLIDFPIDMNGEVSLSVGRANGDRTLTYDNFQYGIIGNLLDDEGLDTSVTLNQQLADTVVDQPRHFFTTNFSVNAPFTNGEELTITTTQQLTEVVVSNESGTPNYFTGRLIAETADDEQLILIPDTQNADTWQATIIDSNGSQSIFGFWSDTIRLPCISATPEDEALIGCPF